MNTTQPMVNISGHTIYQGDCLDIMPKLKGGSFDVIIADVPYGATQCAWDVVIPFKPMWIQIKRLIKPNAAICLFGTEPFSSLLRTSNLKMFKYDWIWKKSHPTGFLNAWKQPLRDSEIISVFYDKQCLYNPQTVDKPLKNIRKRSGRTGKNTNIYGDFKDGDLYRKLPDNKSMPRTILSLPVLDLASKDRHHNTQKPIPLIEQLILTYTNPGETVLDFTMGSGTTVVACHNLKRLSVGIEKDPECFEKAKNRILKATDQHCF